MTLRNLLKFAFLFALIITSNINRFIASQKGNTRQEVVHQEPRINQNDQDPNKNKVKDFLKKHKWPLGIAFVLIVGGAIGTGAYVLTSKDSSKDSDKNPEEIEVTDNQTKE
jgi:hypothetical protein